MKARMRPMQPPLRPQPRPAPPRELRHYRPWLVALFLLGAIYQLLVLLQLSRSPYFGHPILDARYQVEWAFALVAGNEPHAVFFQSPLYSYVLAGFLKLFGWR